MSNEEQRVLAIFTPAFVIIAVCLLIAIIKGIFRFFRWVRGDGKLLYRVQRTSVWNTREYKAIDEYRVYRRWGPFYMAALDYEGKHPSFSTEDAADDYARNHARVKSLDVEGVRGI